MTMPKYGEDCRLGEYRVRRFFLAAVAAVSCGCVSGGRLTGGVLTGSAGTKAFASLTLEVGWVDKQLSRLTAELGGTTTEGARAAHFGVRYDAGGRDHLTWTVSSAVETSPAGTFGLATGGLALRYPTLAHESPDVLGGRMIAIAAEAIAAVGGREASRVDAAIGAGVSFEVLWFGLMR